jgi:hypothetical protein
MYTPNFRPDASAQIQAKMGDEKSRFALTVRFLCRNKKVNMHFKFST